MKTTLFLTLFITLSSLTFGQWTWQNSLPQGNTLQDIKMINEQIGYAVGDAGTIIHTDNGGQSWSVQESYIDVDLRSLSFISEYEGWVIGEEGFLLHTTDGSSWTILNVGVNLDLYSISFTDAYHGWVSGSIIDGNNSKGVVLFTSDGGKTWKKQFEEVDKLRLHNIQFIDPWNGYASGYAVNKKYPIGLIIYTKDGGASWKYLYPGKSYVDIVDADFVSSTHGYISTKMDNTKSINPAILKTENGGDTWENVFIGEKNMKINSVEFIDQYTGWVCGEIGQGLQPKSLIMFTDDGGDNWHTQYSNNNAGLNAIDFSSEVSGVSVGVDGEMVLTSTAGKEWKKLNSGHQFDFRSICFIDESVGYAVGKSILKTEDGGQNWVPVPYLSSKQTINDVYFKDKKDGLAIGEGGLILTTKDAGKTWKSLQTNALSGLKSIHFSDKNNGWIVGKDGAMLNTVNGGDTWSTRFLFGDGSYNDITFVEGKYGWLVCDYGKILHTKDGGSTWKVQEIFSTSDLNAVHFFDKRNGLVVGNDGLILITNDGGRNWKGRYGGTTSNLNSINVMDYNVYVAGDDGYILNSTSKGYSWSYYNRITKKDIHDILFVNERIGWAVGEDGMMLRVELDIKKPRSSMSDFTKSDPINMKAESEFTAYPNPINSNGTTFSYSLTSPSHVQISIFDMNGRQIETLFDGEQTEGIHQVNWNVANLPKGTYFSHLTMDGKKEYKKLVVY